MNKDTVIVNSTHAATVDIAWAAADYRLVDGVTGVTCSTPFPDGLTISSAGLLSASNVQLSFNGEYQCQLNPPHDGDIIVNLRVVGKNLHMDRSQLYRSSPPRQVARRRWGMTLSPPPPPS